eukprot:TRINITY_DN5775_c0_g1_i1.p1 TRINITY_DN5775_c0_g1~~TRINITY_DN5775_c0_g1_i1.p1  ORF type:complete len:382 (+),score=81.41 TRINITY_DN5775_c0_g1_i1:131-1276(+)
MVYGVSFRTRSPLVYEPLPANITRDYIPTPSGNLEILAALPSPSSSSSPTDKRPLLFIHGGFGAATVYLEFLEYFSQLGYPCYALSLRNHGASYSVSFLRMFFTSKYQLSLDIVAGLQYVSRAHSRDVVLIGHSNGGALCQYVISNNMHHLNNSNKTLSSSSSPSSPPSVVNISKLVLLCAGPCYGLLGVYINWAKLDPCFFFRVMWHLGNPRSPLSSTRLVHNAFYCPEFPDERVKDLEERHMPLYESMRWPSTMMLRFADPARILNNLSSSSPSPSPSSLSTNDQQQHPRQVLVVAGSHDKLMSLSLMSKLAYVFRRAVTQRSSSCTHQQQQASLEDPSAAEGVQHGVEYHVVQGSGHHIMGDLQWRDAAAKIASFLDN